MAKEGAGTQIQTSNNNLESDAHPLPIQNPDYGPVVEYTCNVCMPIYSRLVDTKMHQHMENKTPAYNGYCKKKKKHMYNSQMPNSLQSIKYIIFYLTQSYLLVCLLGKLSPMKVAKK